MENWRRSGNLIENKGSYMFKPRILLKTQHVSFLSPNPAQVGTHILAGSPFSTLDPRPISEAREVVAPWRFHLKRRRKWFPIPYSLFPASSGSPEALAAPQLDADDSVRVANADERDVFSQCPFKLDDLVL